MYRRLALFSNLAKYRFHITSPVTKMSSRTISSKAIAFQTYGDPRTQLKAVDRELAPPTDSQVLIKLLAAPINPSDINQVQGIYPSRPVFTTDYEKEPTAVGGNEGVFEVIETGKNVSRVKVGDWVLPGLPCFGTWRTHAVVEETAIYAIPDHHGLTRTQAGTVVVNPSTALEMLRKFVDLKPGDWVVQNGSNSAVGRAVIQLAHQKGFKTLNVIRDRPNLQEMKDDLTSLGATQVVTEDEMGDKSIKEKIEKWIGDSKIRLGLNCVGGKSATNLARNLSEEGHLVTYGGMSMGPVAIGTGDFIFKNIQAHGYWLTAQSKKDPQSRYNTTMETLKLVAEGKIKDVPVTEHTLKCGASAEETTNVFLEAMKNSMDSKGKQILLLD